MNRYTGRLLGILLLSLTAACGIENFESLSDLHPPLALTATSSDNTIFLTFSALNNEDNFAGYNVFIGDDATAVLDQKFALPNELTRVIPFTNHQPFFSASTIELTVSRHTNGLSFQSGIEVFIGVAAYDARNDSNSRTSNVTNIIIQL